MGEPWPGLLSLGSAYEPYNRACNYCSIHNHSRVYTIVIYGTNFEHTRARTHTHTHIHTNTYINTYTNTHTHNKLYNDTIFGPRYKLHVFFQLGLVNIFLTF